MRTLISNGTVVNADGSYRADVLVDGETIAAVSRSESAAGASLAAPEALDRIIAETGMVPAVKSNRGAPVLHERRRSRCFDPPRRHGGSA